MERTLIDDESISQRIDVLALCFLTMNKKLMQLKTNICKDSQKLSFVSKTNRESTSTDHILLYRLPLNISFDKGLLAYQILNAQAINNHQLKGKYECSPPFVVHCHTLWRLATIPWKAEANKYKSTFHREQFPHSSMPFNECLQHTAFLPKEEADCSPR